MSAVSALPSMLSAAAMSVPEPGKEAIIGLVHRTSFGFTEADYALAQSMGYYKYLEYQLNHAAIDDSVSELAIQAAYPTAFQQPYELLAASDSEVRNQLIRSTIMRAIRSKRQLYQRVVEFWGDHFNISATEEIMGYLKSSDDQLVIRANAMTNFPTLLRASAHSAAMLRYLDNVTNKKGSPNENYARELLELHSMGVDGGYTQQDVQEVARCFTGWNVYPVRYTGTPPVLVWGSLTNTFQYVPTDHDNNSKVVLGTTIPAGGGQNDGETVLNMLAVHPSTARFISKKMLKRFWGEAPPDPLVESLMKVYLATGGDVKSMLRFCLNPYLAQGRTPKMRRPFHLFASALRALNANVTTPGSLQTPLFGAGQLPFAWEPPDGYPDTAKFWGELMLPRWNFGASLMNGEYGGVAVDTATLYAGLNTAQKVADRIDQLLFGGKMLPADKDAVRKHMLPDPPSSTRMREATGLAIAAPGFQWY